MRKRMEEVGGAFEALSRPEHGTIVRLTAPLAGLPSVGNGGVG
jgi:signal transduction histidine kinase